MVKEHTATTFVVYRDGEVTEMAFVLVPRFGCLLPPGGHVEADEHGAEAALREVLEETGLRARLLPGPSLPLPDGFPHPAVTAPWWRVVMPACPDGHTAEAHMHSDEVYVAETDTQTPVVEPCHQVRWFTAAELAGACDVSADSRLQAMRVFELLAESAPLTGEKAGTDARDVLQVNKGPQFGGEASARGEAGGSA